MLPALPKAKELSCRQGLRRRLAPAAALAKRGIAVCIPAFQIQSEGRHPL